MGHHDAENDLEHASDIARQMVGRRGMSPAIGPVSVLSAAGQESGVDGVAPATRAGRHRSPPDHRGMLEQALATLRGSRDRLDRLAHTLMDRETLDEDEAYAAAGGRRDTAPARGEAGESPRNQEWRCLAADPTGRARTWLSAAVRTAPGGRWRRPGTARR
jgi:cell division protease FtsH